MYSTHSHKTEQVHTCFWPLEKRMMMGLNTGTTWFLPSFLVNSETWLSKWPFLQAFVITAMHHHGQAKNIPKWVSSVLMFWNAYHHAYLHPESSITPLSSLLANILLVLTNFIFISCLLVDFKWYSENSLYYQIGTSTKVLCRHRYTRYLSACSC